MLTLWDPERNAPLMPELEAIFEPLARTLRAEVEETDDELVVTVDLPGHDPAKMEIAADRDTLTIKSERARKDFVERYVEEIEVPGADPDKADAKFANGVLTVKLPKRLELKPHKIEVH